MKRVDSTAVPEYRKNCRRLAKVLKKENPDISSHEALERTSEPLLSQFHPKKYFGAVSDKI